MSTFLQTFFDFFGRKDHHRAAQPAPPDKPKLESYRSGEWIPLSEAAQRLYDELDGTPWRTAADKEETVQARLDYMAIQLARYAPIEGRSPSSRSYRHIQPDEFNAGVIKSGGKYFQRDYESYLTFADMRVREDHLRDALQRMKAGE